VCEFCSTFGLLLLLWRNLEPELFPLSCCCFALPITLPFSLHHTGSEVLAYNVNPVMSMLVPSKLINRPIDLPHYSSWLWCWTIRASQKMWTYSLKEEGANRKLIYASSLECFQEYVVSRLFMWDMVARYIDMYPRQRYGCFLVRSFVSYPPANNTSHMNAY
jgi:hypothetical protein